MCILHTYKYYTGMFWVTMKVVSEDREKDKRVVLKCTHIMVILGYRYQTLVLIVRRKSRRSLPFLCSKHKKNVEKYSKTDEGIRYVRDLPPFLLVQSLRVLCWFTARSDMSGNFNLKYYRCCIRGK